MKELSQGNPVIVIPGDMIKFRGAENKCYDLLYHDNNAIYWPATTGKTFEECRLDVIKGRGEFIVGAEPGDIIEYWFCAREPGLCYDEEDHEIHPDELWLEIVD